MDDDDKMLEAALGGGASGADVAGDMSKKRKLSDAGEGPSGVEKKGKVGSSDNEGEGSGDDSDKIGGDSSESEGESVNSKDEDEEDGGEGDEEVNQYEYDEFLVQDAEDSLGSDSDDDDADKKARKKKKKTQREGAKLTRLKKNVTRLDEDDRELLIENTIPGDDKAGKTADAGNDDDNSAESDYDDVDEIAPEQQNKYKMTADDGDNEMAGFIVDAEDEEGAPGEASPSAIRREAAPRDASMAQRVAGGPTEDEIQESMDIFGIENLDDLQIDEEDDEYYGDDDNGNILAAQRDSQKMNSLRSTIDRQVLIDNFYTESDEAIREADIPERSFEFLANRTIPGDEERKEEASWMVGKLAEKIQADRDTSPEWKEMSTGTLKDEMLSAVLSVLNFTLVDKLEVPFIWAHRRDYLHAVMTREHLWYIVTLDREWDGIYDQRTRLLQDINSIFKAFEFNSTEFQMDQGSRKSQILSLRGLCAEQEKTIIEWEEEVNKAMDAIDKSEDDLEVESDREKVVALQQRIADMQGELTTSKEMLDSTKTEQDTQLELSLALEQYTSQGIAEVKEAFPKERYEVIIESCTNEQELKDMHAFLSLLLKGAIKDKDSKAEASPKATSDNEGGVTDVETADAAAPAGERTPLSLKPKKKAAGFRDTHYQYTRFRKLAGIRVLINKIFLAVCDMGDAVRHSIATELPPTIPGGVQELEELCSELIDNEVVNSSEQAKKAMTTVVACELAAEPMVKNAVRQKYRAITTISTQPTAKGLLEITPFNEFFGLHWLERKPLSDFLRYDKTLFLKLLQAEKEGLLLITYKHPLDDAGSADVFPYFEDIGFVQNWFPKQTPELDEYPEMRGALDLLRFDAFAVAIKSYLLPALQDEVRRDMIRIGRETIVEEATANFQKMLAVGPYKPPVMDPRDEMRDMLVMCPYRPFYATVVSIHVANGPREPCCMVYLDKEGVLCANEFIPSKAMGKKQEIIRKFIGLHKPDVVILNSSGGRVAKQTMGDLERKIFPKLKEVHEKAIQERKDQGMDYDDFDDEDDNKPYEPQAMILKDDISEIFKQSDRSKKMFPDFQPIMRAAICLGRYAQEPLAEYCNLWTSSSAAGVFGYEALFLKLHPMLQHTKSVRSRLLTCLERALVGAVCDVGVDINAVNQHDHLSAMLAFVGGLGLRKANSLRATIREKLKNVSSRVELLERRVLKLNIWTNAASFLRVEDSGQSNTEVNPFDNTRIHPECYHSHEWAPKICANAMDNEDWAEGQDYFQIVADVKRNSREQLEKKVVEGKKAGGRSKAYLDMWLRGRPTLGVTTYSENIMTAAGLTEMRVRQCELSDKLSNLLLEEYCADLEEKGEGKHKLQFDAIKEEIRFPWLDLRKPLEAPSVHEMFTILTGENDASLHVGLKMMCEVLEIDEKQFFDAASGETKSRPQVIVKTDCGLKGKISMYEVTDERMDGMNFNMQDYVQVGQKLISVVIGVDKYRQSLDLSIKPEYLRADEDWWIGTRVQNRQVARWFESTRQVSVIDLSKLYLGHFNEALALEQYKKTQVSTAANNSASDTRAQGSQQKGKLAHQRVFRHQLFYNCGHAEAEERILNAYFDPTMQQLDGNVIIRPSSKGMDSLSITWAFDIEKRKFMHFEVEERGKEPGAIGLGTDLHIKYGDSNESYSDLDEIYIRFIDPMNDYASQMSSHRNFREGSVEEVEAYLNERAQSDPGRIPYCIRYEPERCGMYCLTWHNSASSQNPVKKVKITLLPTGYLMERRQFTRPSEIIDYLKKHVGGSGASKSSKPSSSSSGARRSRFSDR